MLMLINKSLRFVLLLFVSLPLISVKYKILLVSKKQLAGALLLS